jgi:methylphosphotriester-DNA--protein-cysteine methyltransferase
LICVYAFNACSIFVAALCPSRSPKPSFCKFWRGVNACAICWYSSFDPVLTHQHLCS